MVEETIFIHNKFISTAPRLPFFDGSDLSDINFAYYNRMTGEVWGLRLTTSQPNENSTWQYVPSETDYPDLLHPYEVQAGYCPPGFILFASNHLLEQWSMYVNTTAATDSTDTETPEIAGPQGSPHGRLGNGQDLLHPNPD